MLFGCCDGISVTVLSPIPDDSEIPCPVNGDEPEKPIVGDAILFDSVTGEGSAAFGLIKAFPDRCICLKKVLLVAFVLLSVVGESFAGPPTKGTLELLPRDVFVVVLVIEEEKLDTWEPPRGYAGGNDDVGVTAVVFSPIGLLTERFFFDNAI